MRPKHAALLAADAVGRAARSLCGVASPGVARRRLRTGSAEVEIEVDGDPVTINNDGAEVVVTWRRRLAAPVGGAA